MVVVVDEPLGRYSPSARPTPSIYTPNVAALAVIVPNGTKLINNAKDNKTANSFFIMFSSFLNFL